MKCKKCNSTESTIHVENVGDFCLDCHNDYMAELLGVSKMDEFPRLYQAMMPMGLYIDLRFQI